MSQIGGRALKDSDLKKIAKRFLKNLKKIGLGGEGVLKAINDAVNDAKNKTPTKPESPSVKSTEDSSSQEGETSLAGISEQDTSSQKSNYTNTVYEELCNSPRPFKPENILPEEIKVLGKYLNLIKELDEVKSKLEGELSADKEKELEARKEELDAELKDTRKDGEAIKKSAKDFLRDLIKKNLNTGCLQRAKRIFFKLLVPIFGYHSEEKDEVEAKVKKIFDAIANLTADIDAILLRRYSVSYLSGHAAAAFGGASIILVIKYILRILEATVTFIIRYFSFRIQ